MTWSLTADACSVCLNPGAAHRQSERRPAIGIEMATANWAIESEEDGCPQCHEARRIIHSGQREKPTVSQAAPLRLTTLSYPARGGTRPPGGTRQTRRVTTQGRALRACGPGLDDMNAVITPGRPSWRA